MQANPILAEMTRGNWIENRHRGAICVANAAGEVLSSAGDIERPVFPRSAIKSMQALAIFKSGAADKFGLTDAELALACASHLGEEPHTSGVAALLARLGLSEADLECGAHSPADPKARKALREAHQKPSALHNNCSGKHAGMLAVARALDIDHHGYVGREHQVQKLVRERIEQIIGEPLNEDRCGTDGCSIPTWAAPIRAFAAGFARMATGEGLAPDLADASKSIFDAATGNPFLVRGTGGLDTELMQAFNGRLMIKVGADGVYCGAIRDLGLGFALKIDDGSIPAAEVVVCRLLLAIANPDASQRELLEQKAHVPVVNWRKIEVGTFAATDAAALEL